MIKNRYKEKKKLSFRVMINLLNLNQRNILLLNDVAIKKLKAKIL